MKQIFINYSMKCKSYYLEMEYQEIIVISLPDIVLFSSGKRHIAYYVNSLYKFIVSYVKSCKIFLRSILIEMSCQIIA